MFKSIMSTISSAWNSKESKQIRISYEDAKARLTDAELNRLLEAFSRVASHNTYITKQVFCREVLGELFPTRISECMYGACGGTVRGITFKDLIIILVLITKGKLEEKIRFIFSLYVQDDSTAIRKEDLVKFTEEVEGVVIPDVVLNRLFQFSNTIEYDEFHVWIMDYPAATSISAWLLGEHHDSETPFKLTDDHETPTFYQTLAGVTHLEEEDIIELEKTYWVLHGNSANGRIDAETLRPLISPPLPESIITGFLDAFDENRDGHIDFKEMACGISAAARGPTLERQKFCFKIFDQDKDGLLSRADVFHMVQVMKSVMQENLSEPPSDHVILCLTKEDAVFVDEIFEKVKGESMTLVEYLQFSLSSQLSEQFLTLIYQICQIIFGLRPVTPAEEYEVVTAWLAREEKRDRYVGQVFYLISMEWWMVWLNYVNPGPLAMSHSDSGVGSTLGSMGSQSNSISNISETNGGGSTKSSGRCWSLKKSNIEATIASDNYNVVMTSVSPIVCDAESPTTLSPYSKSSASSLSLVTIDSCRSTASSTPSPISSPESVRRHLTTSSLHGLGREHLHRRRRPDAIDNSSLLAPPSSSLQKIPSLTSEGGRLRRDVEEGRDFKVIPHSLWCALQQWYGSSTGLRRQVVEYDKKLRLELHPITLLLYRHQITNGRTSAGGNAPWAGMAGIYGGAALSTTISYVQNHSHLPKRTLALTASFSRTATLGYVWSFICSNLRLPMQDTRLDLLTSDDLSFAMVLEEEDQTLSELGVRDMSNILIEIRNKDQTWPEEIGSFASSSNDQLRLKRTMSTTLSERGLTGLNNLGNTCFMNSAIQCVSNTIPLTLYFRKKMYLYELNRTNPIGMKGHIAKRYADLIMDVWSGTTKTIAPFKLRFTIGKYAPRFSGFQQNDAQELLAFLLDGLHEDLNRVAEKPYVELKDSDNRPDIICAQEAWENHLLRNKSVIVDLFHGQLKSSVRCKECKHESVRFDPFNYLSLPLPMESFVVCEIIVIRQNGSVPIRYGILCSVDEYVVDVKTQLSNLTGTDGNQLIHPENLILTLIINFRINQILSDDEKIKGGYNGRTMYAFQVSGVHDEEMRSQSGSPCSTEHQIQKLLSSSKYSTSPSIRLPQPAENGFGVGGHSRQSSVSSTTSSSVTHSTTSSMSTAGSSTSTSAPISENSIVVIHRKMLRQEYYFISTQKSRPALFGLPMVIPFQEGMTHLDLYRKVWALVARLVSPLPPDGHNLYNHAQDCDDSLGYEYPFVLRLVKRDAEWCCGTCSWYQMCRGCSIICSEDTKLERIDSSMSAVAIDWDPTALHLRYQMTKEAVAEQHSSVALAHQRQSESVALTTCLENFTNEEELTEDEKYYCAKCECHQLALKKLQIWRLPPILIVHLKRFQALNNRWIKSHKVVDFPFRDFDPSPYLADVPRRTVGAAYSHGEGDGTDSTRSDDKDLFPLQDFHQHRLLPGKDSFELNYRLYAIVCHNGIMGGGHYIAYARNAEGKWHCFNDSSCKEVPEDHIEKSSAYMLFYERKDLDSEAYLPRIDPKALPIVTDDELEAEENDFKKFCMI